MNGKPPKRLFVDGVYKYGNCCVEHELMYVFKLLLLVWYSVDVADVMCDLCSIILWFPGYPQVQVAECRACIVRGYELD